MRKIMICAVAAFIVVPTVAAANCGEGPCAVGGMGTGGVNSGGSAQGFRTEFSSTMFPGNTVSNTGNLDAGRFAITQPGKEPVGTTSGTFRQQSVRGRQTGIFGDWTGQCDIDDFPDCE